MYGMKPHNIKVKPTVGSIYALMNEAKYIISATPLCSTIDIPEIPESFILKEDIEETWEALVNVLPASIPSVFIFLFPLLEAAITATYEKTAKTIDKLPHPVDRDNVKSEKKKLI